MSSSLHLVEWLGFAACGLLGVATVVCGAILVAKMIAAVHEEHVASSRRPVAMRRERTSSPDVYAVIYRAVLDAQRDQDKIAEGPAHDPHAEGELPVFAAQPDLHDAAAISS